MKNLFLHKIRLTSYFLILFVLFSVAFLFLPSYEFTGATLTLFSVNSFLYGFYISPIITGQKSRIDELHKILRAEANALFTLQIQLKNLPKDLRTNLQDRVTDYTKAKLRGKKSNSGEQQYEELISFCLSYKGDHTDEVKKVLDILVSNQQNRTQFTMQMANKVYSNEWLIMLILFTITISVIMLIDVQDILILSIVKALLCTALTMLMIILLKLSTLSHKKAREIWSPFSKLLKTHFYQID